MKKKIFVVIVSLAVLILNSCNSNPVDSPPQPGRRDYTWTIDEINPGQESLNLVRIWGISPSDVWAVGSSSWTATTIWHYNGVQWRCDSTSRNVQPFAIFGFSSNEVWLGNSNSTIWKYDGTKWYQFGEYKVTGFDRIDINYFDGTSRKDIYCVGFADIYNSNTAKAIMLHYNGSDWSFVNIPTTKVSFETVAIDQSSGILVMSGTVYDPAGFVAKVYCWDGKELKELLSDYGWSFVTKLGTEIFATLGSKIYKYNNWQLTLWKDNSGTGINGNIICGRSRNDFFMKAQDGITHFNGTDFETLYTTNLTVERGITFDKDVFFIGKNYSSGKNYIIHGQLK